jgi:hypothetical protein
LESIKAEKPFHTMGIYPFKEGNARKMLGKKKAPRESGGAFVYCTTPNSTLSPHSSENWAALGGGYPYLQLEKAGSKGRLSILQGLYGLLQAQLLATRLPNQEFCPSYPLFSFSLWP